MRAMCEHSGPVLEGSVAGPDPYAVSGIDPVKPRPRHLERERPMPSMCLSTDSPWRKALHANGARYYTANCLST